jgi:hypothetical protein
MRASVRFLATAGVTTGLLAAGSPALADSAGNDGVNVGNDNNIVIAPVQVCGDGLVGGVTNVVLGSPQRNECVNAPLVDHPSNK